MNFLSLQKAFIRDIPCKFTTFKFAKYVSGVVSITLPPVYTLSFTLSASLKNLFVAQQSDYPNLLPVAIYS